MRQCSSSELPIKSASLPSPVLEPDTIADGHSEPRSNATMHPAGTQDTAPALQQAVPARVEHRHKRFQQKLVIGAGNKAEGQSRGNVSAAKPKYTPLELQIVELRDKHPGVLLIVEVNPLLQHFRWQLS